MNNQAELKKSLGPYWRRTLNFGVGKCPTGCMDTFCYCGRYPWSKGPFRVKTDLSKLGRQLERFKWEPGPCAMYEDQWDIMMSSSHDPFTPAALDTATRIFDLLSHAKNVLPHLRVLSKCWGQGFYYYNLLKGPLYGATITTLDEDLSKQLQPNATLPYNTDRYLPKRNLLNELIMLNGEGDRKTWISSEPMFRGMDLHKAASELDDYCCLPWEWWVGHLNIRGKVPKFVKDAALSDQEIVCQFEEVTESFPDVIWYLKTDVEVDEK